MKSNMYTDCLLIRRRERVHIVLSCSCLCCSIWTVQLVDPRDSPLNVLRGSSEKRLWKHRAKTPGMWSSKQTCCSVVMTPLCPLHFVQDIHFSSSFASRFLSVCFLSSISYFSSPLRQLNTQCSILAFLSLPFQWPPSPFQSPLIFLPFLFSCINHFPSIPSSFPPPLVPSFLFTKNFSLAHWHIAWTILNSFTTSQKCFRKFAWK